MRICKYCNSFFEDEGSYCSKCGHETITYVPAVSVEAEPATNPEYVQPAVTEEMPVVSTEDTSAVSSKVMAYIGMGLGIFGFALGISLFFASFSAFSEVSAELGLIYMTYSIFSMGGCIAGLCLTSKASSYGIRSGACVTGKVLSIVGISVNVLTFIISFLGTLITTV